MALVCGLARVHPHVLPDKCVGCGQGIEVCPAGVISRADQPLDRVGRERQVLSRCPRFDLNLCVDCLCCVEV
jgi:formate hydrogenlyase subunit 6/NADH:ubiquinone oxidoreductase subunit I